MATRLIAVVLVAISLVGLLLYSQHRNLPARVSGFVEADEIRIGSRVGGRVEKVLVQEGERVAQGQVLIELEPYDLRQRESEAIAKLAALDAVYRRKVAGSRDEEIAQAHARYNQAKAELDRIEAGPRAQEIQAARGRLEVAAAEMTLARRNFDRASQLLESNAIAREDFDMASERLAASEANVVVRRQELELLEEGYREEEKRQTQAKVDEAYEAWQLAKSGTRTEEIEEAKAAREAAEANLAAIREQIKELVITCPVDGVIESLDLQKGDIVPTGAPVLSVMDEASLWVRAYVPQNRIPIQVGQQLWVTVDSLGDRRIKGQVSFISRQAEFTPSNVQTPDERAKQVFRIKVEIKEKLDEIRPGMTADVWLEDSGVSS